MNQGCARYFSTPFYFPKFSQGRGVSCTILFSGGQFQNLPAPSTSNRRRRHNFRKCLAIFQKLFHRNEKTQKFGCIVSNFFCGKCFRKVFPENLFQKKLFLNAAIDYKLGYIGVWVSIRYNDIFSCSGNGLNFTILPLGGRLHGFQRKVMIQIPVMQSSLLMRALYQRQSYFYTTAMEKQCSMIFRKCQR